MKMKSEFDLLKIGVFLIGIAGMIIALVAFIYLMTIMGWGPWWGPWWGPYREPFYAYCTEKAIIIEAMETLESVKVLDNQQVVCSFDKIPAGSEELCIVNVTGFYVVQVRNRKDVVECIQQQIIPAPPVEITPLEEFC